jgi:hypothetical protein
MTDDEAQIATVLERWASAVHEHHSFADAD